VCFLEKDKIGIGKGTFYLTGKIYLLGNSKQAAKTEAAKAAICTLVSKEIYSAEGQAIMLSIHRGNFVFSFSLFFSKWTKWKSFTICS